VSIVAKELTVHSDKRGSVREAFRASWFPGVPPIVQVVHSESRPGVMRAMHHHRQQYDIWHFVKGEAFVQLYDPETGWYSGDWYGPNDTLVIPPGVAHGFYTSSGCILTYYLTREFDGTDEFEFDALDPEYPGAIDWPEPDARGYIRSKRDLNAPSFDHWLLDVERSA
jgi:dTDP-4-dehydrorhamnose 3,5-epimerase